MGDHFVSTHQMWVLEYSNLERWKYRGCKTSTRGKVGDVTVRPSKEPRCAVLFLHWIWPDLKWFSSLSCQRWWPLSVCFRVHWNVRVLQTSRSTQPACVQVTGWGDKTLQVSFPITKSCGKIRTWRSRIPHVAVDPKVTITSRFPLPSPSLWTNAGSASASEQPSSQNPPWSMRTSFSCGGAGM